MAGKRRVQEDFPPITRSDFAKYLEAASERVYVRKPELAGRDASLLAFEFLLKSRVSEATGRRYPDYGKAIENVEFVDEWRGLCMRDFKKATVKGVAVLRVHMRVLKRGRRKRICPKCEKKNALDSKFCRFCGAGILKAKFDCRLKEHFEWDSVRLDDPFVKYILEWIKWKYENGAGANARVWAITRNRAWQIMRDLGIMNHTQRHWRATQLADVLDPFELKESLHRATMPFEYVHRSESRRIEKEAEVDRKWA